VQAQYVLREPHAAERDQQAADADEGEFETLAPPVMRAPFVAEGPVPVAEPVEDDRDRRRGEGRPERALGDVLRIQRGCAQQVEQGDVDDKADEPHCSHANELGDQQSHRRHLFVSG
jgi:hypothetical protein